MLKESQLKVFLHENFENKLKSSFPKLRDYKIVKKSLDARNSRKIHYLYTLLISETEALPESKSYVLDSLETDYKVTIVGAGPGGLFAALRLLDRGIACQIVERGKPVLKRMKDIAQHWRHGKIHPNSNVCFGEGGAGTFSDGKLVTRVKSPHKNYVLEKFIEYGAPEEIAFVAQPHVGSNKIRKIIHNLTQDLQVRGCEVRFENLVTSFDWGESQLKSVSVNDQELRTDAFILATGHSAHDVFEKLITDGLHVETQSMAMGFRIEHPQKWLNKTQYGKHWESEKLPVASYKVTHQEVEAQRGTYSFCMCPGGYVLASSTQGGRMVVNGMSNANHASGFANSGLVVQVNKEEWYPGGIQEALDFQKTIEEKAQQLVYEAGGSLEIPAQRVVDFLENKVGPLPKSSSPSGVIAVNLRNVYPEKLTRSFIKALHVFEKKMPGFISEEALLHGVESRTSSPLRILRDKEFLYAPQYKNFYPCGEGAGYAGGITSAAIDGVKIADSIYAQLKERTEL